MKTNLLLVAAFLGTVGLVHATPRHIPAEALNGYPKNMAREHLGTNLVVFDPASQSYVPTKAAAAWLDDDVSTGWKAASGKTYYVLTLPEADLLTNFMVSARNSRGTISLYAGDELAKPGADSWSPIATNEDLASVNNRKLEKPFSRFAKYLLIETDLTEAGPWYSLYAYGERAAVAYNLGKRTSAVDLASSFDPDTNDQTAFSFSSLYTGGLVTEINGSASDRVNWQQAIDDNPQTSVAITSSDGDKPSMIVKFGSPLAIERIAVLTGDASRGKLDFYLVESLDTAPSVATNSAPNFIRVANTGSETSKTTDTASLSGRTPIASMTLDDSTDRTSIEFPATQAAYLLIRWTPADGQSELVLSEVNSFTSASLSTYQLVSALPVAGEISEDGDVSKDGKTFIDFKGGKGILPPAVAEILPAKNPFVPAGLGFPPNITNTAVGGPAFLETPASP